MSREKLLWLSGAHSDVNGLGFAQIRFHRTAVFWAKSVGSCGLVVVLSLIKVGFLIKRGEISI